MTNDQTPQAADLHTAELIPHLERAFQTGFPRFLEEWKELVRIPSVSAQPEHHADCHRCADWLHAHLAAMGLDSQVIPTPGQPLVLARRPGHAGAPRILFYGHYDVQPPDPLAEWVSPPFDPAVRDNRLYGRGAEDNKGQFFYALKAVETLLHLAALPCTLTILLEGEEEFGSRGLAAVLPSIRDRIQSDLLLVTDVGTVPSGRATLNLGLRGIVTLTAVLHGPPHDLHSGLYGGAVANPAAGMARLLASLHDDQGRITVPGFLDGIVPPTDSERALAARFAVDPAVFRDRMGVVPAGGEQGFPLVERVGMRPTIEINGVHSGYGGPGSKTIIPADAMAKISARLVAGQNPQLALDAICRHLETAAAQLPGLRLEIPEKSASGAALRHRPDSRAAQLAAGVMQSLFGEEPACVWDGGSIPVIPLLAAAAGAEPLLTGFSRDTDRPHSPNESFSFDQFHRGFLYVATLLASTTHWGPRAA